VLQAQSDFPGSGPGHLYTLRYYFVATNALGMTAQSETYHNVTLDTRFCVH
jgi:hypothetical protein